MDCILMPFLHPRETDAAMLPGARHLSPGHHASPSCCLPASLPLTQAQAMDILRQFQNLDRHSLENMRTWLNQPQVAGELRRQDELAGIAAFAGKKAARTPDALLAVQAQKTLLWLWVMEDSIYEIAALEKQCRLAAARLRDTLKEPAATAASCMDKMQSESMESDVAEPDFSGFPWKAAVACACRFIAASTPILLEEPAFGEACEHLDFAPAPGEDLPAGSRLLRAAGPLWQMLGHSRPMQEENLRDIYNVDRIWLGISNV